VALADETTTRRLDELHPDPRNPRIAEEEREFEDEPLLYAYLERHFDALVLAESIVEHGYFQSEPLIIAEEGEQWLVLEGNRRLTALAGLTRPEVRAAFRSPARWERLSEQAATSRPDVNAEMDIPVVIADTREDADPVIGFRHISGVKQWTPIQKARFLRHLIDESGYDFEQASETTGEERQTVQMLYRNQDILRRLRDEGREDLAEKAEGRFGLFTAALNRAGIRGFLEVNRAGDVAERQAQFASDAIPRAEEALDYIYGREGRPKVIKDDRDLTRLAIVLNQPVALEELRNTRDLDAAYAQTEGPAGDVMRRLRTGLTYVRNAGSGIEQLPDPEDALEVLQEISDLVAELRSRLDGGGSTT
jgi:hypothetical protein